MTSTSYEKKYNFYTEKDKEINFSYRNTIKKYFIRFGEKGDSILIPLIGEPAIKVIQYCLNNKIKSNKYTIDKKSGLLIDNVLKKKYWIEYNALENRYYFTNGKEKIYKNIL